MPKPDPFAVDDDNPVLSVAQLVALKPASAVFTPDQLEVLGQRRGPGRPLKADRKVEIKLRVAPNVLAAFKAKGPGWQTRMHDALERAAEVDGREGATDVGVMIRSVMVP